MSYKIKLYTLYQNQFPSKSKNLIVILTTMQSPHLEAYFHYIQENLRKYNKIFILYHMWNIAKHVTIINKTVTKIKCRAT